MSYLRFKLRQLMQRMWFLPAAFSAVAVLTVIIAYVLARFAPEELPFVMPTNAVQSILQILASSLLTVAVFALSTVVGAFSAASNSTTPRAVPLIAGDLRAQTSISVFIGAFLFSIVGIIGLSAGLYSEAGRLFLFIVTLGVLILVVAALIRWIGQISAIGRVSHTIGVVEGATRDALKVMREHPLLDCRRLDGEPEGEPIAPERPGYVQHCDAGALQDLAKEHDLIVTVLSRPGAYATPVRPLMMVKGVLDDELRDALKDCFVLGDQRAYDSDPRYGFIVLGEIADKAMSASINDPGTAIVVIDTVTRLLLDWDDEHREGEHDRILVAPLVPRDVLDDFYRPLARDGAHVIEVVSRMLKSLETVAACKPILADAARETAGNVVSRAMKAMDDERDVADLQTLSAWATKRS
ncbi:Uncharacterized membrane protein [Devosia lucknowensis]|uniref:Uncharacterized membrane protein n=1 Tax=Devosia lucknowensis TaxID=1096929 RepID=A0A1Y6EJF2_9HYPH|nr:DUF2254 domain-containing protein [Devosia lucknowensis]SMQ61080.1 Uncharacterized membrane protein [Devosia lucknowensis]